MKPWIIKKYLPSMEYFVIEMKDMKHLTIRFDNVNNVLRNLECCYIILLFSP